ncbi:MAG: hypothetical protein C0403_17615 [Desulfobacterium sp.]|nr:hypothetical protein [Desulfobacterium sp.]
MYLKNQPELFLKTILLAMAIAVLARKFLLGALGRLLENHADRFQYTVILQALQSFQSSTLKRKGTV